MTIRHALVVDDSRSARMMLQRLLSKINVQAEAVESAEEALKYLERQQPDVIFMDHMMPGMDGLEATQLIKSNPLTAAIPTIMYTSKEGREYQEIALSHGAQGVLAKPASHEAVMAVIHSLDEPAANDEPAGAAAQIPLIEIDRLVQKHVREAMNAIRAEISSQQEDAARGLQSGQESRAEELQQRLEQRLEYWQQDILQQLSEQALFQKTRAQNQRLAIAVADKLVKKNADDLITVIRTSKTAVEASLAGLREELRQEIRQTGSRALLTGLAGGALLGGLIGIAAAILL